MFWRQALAVAAKDLRLEVRGREALNTVLPFAAMTLLAFGFAFGPGRDELQGAAPAFLWLAAFFAGILTLRRAYESETENGALEGIILSPADRAAVYIGKTAAALVVLLALQAAAVGLSAVLFGFRTPPNFALLGAVLFLGSLGLATIGSFFSALAAIARAREALLPLLVLPAVAPLLIAAIGATAAALGVGRGAGGWLRLLIGFDVVALAVCLVVFEHVVEE